MAALDGGQATTRPLPQQIPTLWTRRKREVEARPGAATCPSPAPSGRTAFSIPDLHLPRRPVLPSNCNGKTRRLLIHQEPSEHHSSKASIQWHYPRYHSLSLQQQSICRPRSRRCLSLTLAPFGGHVQARPRTRRTVAVAIGCRLAAPCWRGVRTSTSPESRHHAPGPLPEAARRWRRQQH